MKTFSRLRDAVNFIDAEVGICTLEGIDPPVRNLSQCIVCQRWYDTISDGWHEESCDDNVA